MIKTYTIARPIIRKLINRWKWLRVVPVFRRYADGGDLSTAERAEEAERKRNEQV